MAKCYTTRSGKLTHLLAYEWAAQGSRAPACGQNRSIWGSGYMNFVGEGMPTCPKCKVIAEERTVSDETE